MYDVRTFSALDTFLGHAVKGPTPMAFQRSAAVLALTRGKEITFENVRLRMQAGGIKAVDTSSVDLGSHQAFWFACSQLHPGTALWPQ